MTTMIGIFLNNVGFVPPLQLANYTENRSDWEVCVRSNKELNNRVMILKSVLQCVCNSCHGWGRRILEKCFPGWDWFVFCSFARSRVHSAYCAF